jgi:hypothetical protein
MPDVINRAIKVTRADETDPPNKALGRLGFQLGLDPIESIIDVHWCCTASNSCMRFLSMKSTACRCRWTQRATSAGEPND